MAKRDYYEVLGVGRDADESTLKNAYRRLAMKYHPDRSPDNPEAESRFKEAKEAHDVLSDSRKRSAYDQFGHAGVEAGNSAGGGFSGAEAFSDLFGDVFGDIFGGGRRGARTDVYRGADLRYELELSLEQAVRGDSVKIDIPTHVACDRCESSGAEPGTQPVDCPSCGGAGRIRVQQGVFSIQQTCPRCRGEGRTIEKACRDCRGRGRVRHRRTLAVKIPAGVDNGDRIRLPGEGESGRNGGPPGDLYVDVAVADHSIFSREGRDLICEVPISFVTAALGGSIEVPSLDGQIVLKVPAETQSGRVLRLRGKGVRSARASGVGDLYCRVQVETPVNLTDGQKARLEAFDEAVTQGGTGHSPRATSWFDGVKHFFDRMGA
ncbi:molecular chaperone DnaJ [Candidatus Rariloculus sp.]|uniref:molecular chaperone DnaJ n=1 Tax=Candidatus Rariloculus sp. TaxID=3101265 RepID=UPI003D13B572